MASVERRLAALRDYRKTMSTDETTFLVSGGGEFHTKQDPVSYLLENGAHTPDGRRIVLYPHPVEGVDGLSMSIYELLDEAIERGKLELPALESDDVM